MPEPLRASQRTEASSVHPAVAELRALRADWYHAIAELDAFLEELRLLAGDSEPSDEEMTSPSDK